MREILIIGVLQLQGNSVQGVVAKVPKPPNETQNQLTMKTDHLFSIEDLGRVNYLQKTSVR